MTRQKKEILKKIDDANNFILADMELGCGFAPTNFYNEVEQEIYNLQKQLAELSHYDNVEDMLYDIKNPMTNSFICA